MKSIVDASRLQIRLYFCRAGSVRIYFHAALTMSYGVGIEISSTIRQAGILLQRFRHWISSNIARALAGDVPTSRRAEPNRLRSITFKNGVYSNFHQYAV